MGILSLVAQYVLSAPMAPVGCQSMTCCAHLFMFHCPCDDCKLLRLFWWRHRHPGVFLGLPAHSWWCEGMGCSLGGIGGNRVKGRDGGETGQTLGKCVHTEMVQELWDEGMGEGLVRTVHKEVES